MATVNVNIFLSKYFPLRYFIRNIRKFKGSNYSLLFSVPYSGTLGLSDRKLYRLWENVKNKFSFRSFKPKVCRGKVGWRIFINSPQIFDASQITNKIHSEIKFLQTLQALQVLDNFDIVDRQIEIFETFEHVDILDFCYEVILHEKDFEIPAVLIEQLNFFDVFLMQGNFFETWNFAFIVLCSFSYQIQRYSHHFFSVSVPSTFWSWSTMRHRIDQTFSSLGNQRLTRCSKFRIDGNARLFNILN